MVLQNRLELVEAYKSFVKPDSPLMIPLYRKDGTLLAPKNKELTQEQTTRLLLNVELYTPRAQLLKALEKISIISNEKGTDVAFSIHSPFLRTKKLIEELKTVRETYSDSFFIQILAISSRIQNVCKTNANQAIAQCITNQTLEPAYVQPVLCAILIYQMTSYLEWKSSEIDKLICAALTMDIAHHKAAAHNEQHPLLAVDRLKSLGVAEEKWLSYVATHHEKSDGSGYPKGLGNYSLSWGSIILSILDDYSKSILGVELKNRIPPKVAAKSALHDNVSRYHLINTTAFMQNVGRYPAGTLLKLESRKTGIVIRQSEHPKQPYIKIIMDEKGTMINETQLQHAGVFPYQIQSSMENSSLYKKLDLEMIYK